MKNKVIFYGSLVTLSAISVTVFVSVMRKNKIIKQLEDNIRKNALGGSFSDLSTSNAFSTSYWKTVSGATLLPVVTAQTYATDIFKLLNGAKDVDGTLSSKFKELKNQAQVSQVTFYYNQSGDSLYDDLNTVDTVGGTLVKIGNIIGLSTLFPSIKSATTGTSIIFTYIKSLPLK
jgi:hypothetical protein